MDARPLDLGQPVDAPDLGAARLDAPRLRRERSARRPLVDPLTLAATLFFLIAVAAAAYPAFRAGPANGASLLLLIGLAGVALAGVFVFGMSERDAGPKPERAIAFTDSLVEPASIVRPDGRLVETNAAWRSEVGLSARLPKSAIGGSALYAALIAARRDGASETAMRIGETERTLLVSRVGDARLLVRVAMQGAARPSP